MKKIPTIFERDWAGEHGPPGRAIVDKPHPDCGWVFAGEGIPTRKLDGTCCLVQGGVLFKRQEVKPPKRQRGKLPPQNYVPSLPPGFVTVELHDNEDGLPVVTGWVPVGDGPEDRLHRETFEAGRLPGADWGLPDGTYELVGPKVNGNPEHYTAHFLISHEDLALEDDVPRDFDGLRAWLTDRDVEGVVWHHVDGRMGKIKGRDFGISR